MQGPVTIRPAKLGDLESFADHVVTHAAESGLGGSPHFAIARSLTRQTVRDAAKERWRRGLDEPLWGRAWLLRPEGKTIVVGHLELRGGRFEGELHRALLGMGIQRAFTGRGAGTRLLEAAVTWARDEAGLSWIDLGVFAGNEPARKLYRRAGFVEVGMHADAFRIDGGVSIDDVQMTLDLKKA